MLLPYFVKDTTPNEGELGFNPDKYISGSGYLGYARSGLLYARKRQADRHRIGIKLNYGGVTINVYGAEGQSIQDLADEIEERINFGVARKTAAWTKKPPFGGL